MTNSGLREEKDGQNGFRVSEEKNEQEGRVQGQGEEKNEYDGFRFKRRMDRTVKELKDEQEGFRVREKRRMNMMGLGLREEKDG